ncbi:MAG: ribonuclease III [Sphingomonadaceae bacterium]
MASAGSGSGAALTDAVRRWAASALVTPPTDDALLLTALTHKSVGACNYERLEFLGDRALGLAIAAWLYERFPNEKEGILNRRFARLVSRETCARVARRLGVPDHVRLGPQARSDGGANSDNILGDVMEALIGATFLTGGMTAVDRLVRAAWADELDDLALAPKHPKSALQEWAAARGLKEPSYRLLGRSGPHHSPRFRVSLDVGGLPPVEAEGASKQDAETRAAAAFLASHAG